MADRERSGGDSSSEEEDPKWKAAINSIVTTTVYGASATKPAATQSHEDGDFRHNPKKLTHAQIKVKKLLNEMVENTLDFVKDTVNVPEDKPENDCGVRLFKRCSTGIIFDHVDELEGPKKKPNLRPDRGVEGNSKEFKKRIKSIAVDGSDVLSAAIEAAAKASARLEAKEAAAKAKAKKEEERVAELKKVRGEKWLPSVARELQLNKKQHGDLQNRKDPCIHSTYINFGGKQWKSHYLKKHRITLGYKKLLKEDYVRERDHLLLM